MTKNQVSDLRWLVDRVLTAKLAIASAERNGAEAHDKLESFLQNLITQPEPAYKTSVPKLDKITQPIVDPVPVDPFSDGAKW